MFYCRVRASVSPWHNVFTRLLLLMLILTREREDLRGGEPLFKKHGKAAGKSVCNSRQVTNRNLQNHALNRDSFILFITVLYYVGSGFRVPKCVSYPWVLGHWDQWTYVKGSSHTVITPGWLTAPMHVERTQHQNLGLRRECPVRWWGVNNGKFSLQPLEFGIFITFNPD